MRHALRTYICIFTYTHTRHGNGIYTSVKGAVYKGQYITGDRSGWGEYANSRGDVYEGQWRKNVSFSCCVLHVASPHNCVHCCALRLFVIVDFGRSSR